MAAKRPWAERQPLLLLGPEPVRAEVIRSAGALEGGGATALRATSPVTHVPWLPGIE